MPKRWLKYFFILVENLRFCALKKDEKFDFKKVFPPSAGLFGAIFYFYH